MSRLRAADLPAVAVAGSRHLLAKLTGGYRKTAAAAALIRDAEGRILLVEVGPVDVRWGLPGGRLERGETPERGVVREVHEETGLDVAVDSLCAVVARPNALILIFACRVVSGVARAAAPLEIGRVGWFGEAEAMERLDAAARIHLRAALDAPGSAGYVVDPTPRRGWLRRLRGR